MSNSDGRGGAYAAAFRLLEELDELNVSAKMLVAENTRNYRSVIGPVSKLSKGIGILAPILDALPLELYRKRERTIFSPAWLPDILSKKVALINPDIIHLHWIAGGFLRIETLRKFQKPIVWTLHDMWGFTGGCHYDNSCGRYKESCGICPQLNSKRQSDLSHWVWKRKMKAWKDIDITIVTPSRWLAECAMKSFIFRGRRVEVIPNGLNTEIYKPVDKGIARERLGLPRDKKLILFGAVNATSDKRKGYHFLKPAIEGLINDGFYEKAELVIFGASEPAEPQNFGMKAHYMGQLHDDVSLALLYGATDIFVAPSIQENLSNAVMEALSCGTPCVAFDIGGMPDMIQHELTGYLARPFETNDLSKGISWVLEDDKRWQVLSRQARQKVEKEFDIRLMAQRYLDLYNEIIE